MNLFPLLLALLAPPAGFTEAPAYVPLFTPRGAPAGAFATFTTPRPLDAVLAELPDDGSLARVGGSFQPRLESPADAFGLSGGYNRWKLALLFGARRVSVARGPRTENGQVVQAWTLISPYPDAQLERVNSGTLLIVLDLVARSP